MIKITPLGEDGERDLKLAQSQLSYWKRKLLHYTDGSILLEPMDEEEIKMFERAMEKNE